MTLNAVISLFAFFSPNSTDFQVDYITVVKDRPIMSVKYRLPVPSTFGENYNAPCSAVFLHLVLFYQSSNRAVDGHQMYFGGSVVGKTSNICIEISPIPPQIFTGGGGQKVHSLALFKTSLNFEPYAFENAAKYRKSETKMQCCDDRQLCPGQVW